MTGVESSLLRVESSRGASRIHRGAADALLPCPNCTLRSRPVDGMGRPQFTNGRHSGAVMLLHCCDLSRLGKPFAAWPRDGEDRRIAMTTAQENEWRLTSRILIANWWRVRRLTGKAEMLQWLRDNRGITPEMEELQ